VHHHTPVPPGQAVRPSAAGDHRGGAGQDGARASQGVEQHEQLPLHPEILDHAFLHPIRARDRVGQLVDDGDAIQDDGRVLIEQIAAVQLVETARNVPGRGRPLRRVVVHQAHRRAGSREDNRPSQPDTARSDDCDSGVIGHAPAPEVLHW
jgi:hypothetical protein